MADDEDPTVVGQLELLNGQVGRLLKHMEVPATPRDRWVRSDDDRTRDLLGRLKPQRLTFAKFVDHIPGLAERVRKVPSSAVVDESQKPGEETANVQCPCGAHPVAEEHLTECPGKCGRWYIYNAAVYVVYGSMEPPPLKAA